MHQLLGVVGRLSAVLCLRRVLIPLRRSGSLARRLLPILRLAVLCLLLLWRGWWLCGTMVTTSLAAELRRCRQLLSVLAALGCGLLSVLATRWCRLLCVLAALRFRLLVILLRSPVR